MTSHLERRRRSAQALLGLNNLIPERVGGRGIELRRHMSRLLALVFGVLTAHFANIGLLGRLGLPTSEAWDVFLSGLLLASGAEPVHPVVRWIEEKKAQSKETTKRIAGQQSAG